MHITLESDYAVRITFCLAKHGGRMDAKGISEKTGVTVRFSLKILGKLVAGGIVRSFKGARGGYELAKKPDEITLADVISTAQGPYMLSRCLQGDFKCSGMDKRDACKFHEIYQSISNDVSERLNNIKFSDLTGEPAGETKLPT